MAEKQNLDLTSGQSRIVVRNSTASAENDVNGGSGVIHLFSGTNTSLTERVFFKFYDSAAPTVGTTAPEIVIPVNEGITQRVAFVLGVTNATGISVACTTTGGTAGTTNPSSIASFEMTVV